MNCWRDKTKSVRLENLSDELMPDEKSIHDTKYHSIVI
jgi:hypothetical protein